MIPGEGPICITALRAAVDATEPGTTERSLAELTLSMWLHVRQCQQARAESAVCSDIEGMVNGCPNPDRPYLDWKCCGQHEALREQRDMLEKCAANLGVRLTYDVLRPIED